MILGYRKWMQSPNSSDFPIALPTPVASPEKQSVATQTRTEPEVPIVTRPERQSVATQTQTEPEIPEVPPFTATSPQVHSVATHTHAAESLKAEATGLGPGSVTTSVTATAPSNIQPPPSNTQPHDDKGSAQVDCDVIVLDSSDDEPLVQPVKQPTAKLTQAWSPLLYVSPVLSIASHSSQLFVSCSGKIVRINVATGKELPSWEIHRNLRFLCTTLSECQTTYLLLGAERSTVHSLSPDGDFLMRKSLTRKITAMHVCDNRVFVGLASGHLVQLTTMLAQQTERKIQGGEISAIVVNDRCCARMLTVTRQVTWCALKELGALKF